MKRFLAIATLAASLCACKSAEDKRLELSARDDAECENIGAKRDTPAYTDCRLRLKEIRAKIIAGALAAPSDSHSTVCNKTGNTTICN